MMLNDVTGFSGGSLCLNNLKLLFTQQRLSDQTFLLPDNRHRWDGRFPPLNNPSPEEYFAALQDGTGNFHGVIPTAYIWNAKLLLKKLM